MSNLEAVRGEIVKAERVFASSKNYPFETRVKAWAQLLLLRSLEKGLDNVSNRPTMRPEAIKHLELVF